MPEFGTTLMPMGGGGDTDWSLIRGRDVSIPSPIAIQSFAGYDSNGDGTNDDTLVTTGSATSGEIHRFTAGMVVTIVSNLGDDEYNGTHTVKSAGLTDYAFTIDKAYVATSASLIRVYGPPSATVADAGLFLLDTVGNGDLTETKHVKASTVKTYVNTDSALSGTTTLEATSSVAGAIVFKEATDNGTNTTTLRGPAANATNDVITLPDSGGTLALEAAIPLNTLRDNIANTITVTDFGANPCFKVDANQPATNTAEDSKGLWIDYDRTVASSGTAAHNDIGIDLDVNAASLGTSSVIGMDIDVVGASSGTHTAYGLTVDVGSADVNYAALFNGGNVGIGVNDPDAQLEVLSTSTQLKLSYNTGDYFSVAVGNNADTTISTVDADTAAGHLRLHIDGALAIKTAGGVSQMYVTGNDNDYAHFEVGSNGDLEIKTVDAGGALAHLNIEPDGHVEFDGCAVGFDLETPTYNASDTDVSFITGNKQFVTFGSGNITDLNLIFPETSGNFVLLVKQDGTGSRTITNYKAGDLVNSDAADGSATVKFAGGSNPTLTTDANHVDILSFFWDADNQIAYGVATLDFQF